MKFTCVGFDVKEWPPGDVLSVDETSWEGNSRIYSEVSERYSIPQNEYQLLEFRSMEKLSEVIDFISASNDSNLIAVEIPSHVVCLNNERYGYRTGVESIDLTLFCFLGYDVCDINGFFSVLHHPKIVAMRGQKSLIHENEIQTALEIAKIANFIDKDHSPFSVAKIYSLKRVD